MPAVRVLGAALGVAAALVVVQQTPAAAIGTLPCKPGSPGCVVVGVGEPGQPGGPGSGGGDNGGGPPKPDPCAGDTGYSYIACSAGGVISLAVCVPIYEQNKDSLTLAALNALLASNGCPATASLAPPSPATLAQQAAAGFQLPSPTGGRYPSGTMPAGSTNPPAGTPYTVVGPAYTWYWTDASTWKSSTATARAGNVWATVTASPTMLAMTPGDGRAAVSCNGPGSVWRSGVNGPWDPSPSGCQYQYPQSSIHEPNQEVTATYTITWQLIWTGSGNTSGTLTAKTTTSTSTFAVAEVESVVTN